MCEHLFEEPVPSEVTLHLLLQGDIFEIIPHTSHPRPLDVAPYLSTDVCDNPFCLYLFSFLSLAPALFKSNHRPPPLEKIGHHIE